jgi:hypothetical protein
MASEKDSTGGATPSKEKAVRAVTEVGGVGSSDDPAPDLWSGEPTEERRDATCSAEVKSSKGRGDGPRGLPAPEKVRKLQITLYRKAKSKPDYRFWSLYREVQRADVLETALRRVKANAGAAGVDGVSIEDLAADAQLETAWLKALREELRHKTYRPAPVRRVEIPKASGGVRRLGIPTVKDRVVQMAVYLVLMPIFEADFHPRSFGFRPGRGSASANTRVRAFGRDRLDLAGGQRGAGGRHAVRVFGPAARAHNPGNRRQPIMENIPCQRAPSIEPMVRSQKRPFVPLCRMDAGEDLELVFYRSPGQWRELVFSNQRARVL